MCEREGGAGQRRHVTGVATRTERIQGRAARPAASSINARTGSRCRTSHRYARPSTPLDRKRGDAVGAVAVDAWASSDDGAHDGATTMALICDVCFRNVRIVPPWFKSHAYHPPHTHTQLILLQALVYRASAYHNVLVPGARERRRFSAVQVQRRHGAAVFLEPRLHASLVHPQRRQPHHTILCVCVCVWVGRCRSSYVIGVCRTSAPINAHTASRCTARLWTPTACSCLSGVPTGDGVASLGHADNSTAP